MVRGLERFKEHFKEYTDRYVLIGGVACLLQMEVVGESFRATKDLDIVLQIEAMDADLAGALWDFVKLGGYTRRLKHDGREQCYRFEKPRDETWPYMLELFSRVPDLLQREGGSQITRIHIDDTISSLSAILLDTEYYAFLCAGKTVTADLPVLRPEYLIPLKARAWLDLSERNEKGEPVDANTVKKHRNDLFRLYRIVSPEPKIPLQGRIREDMQEFLNRIPKEISLKPFGYRGTMVDTVLDGLRTLYAL